MITHLVNELEESGLVLLPDLVTPDQLRGMQRAFDARLRRIRWNDVDGYEKTERYRHMVQDVLTLDPAFLRVALHPAVKQLLSAYLGDRFELVEAKGWESVPTRRDFHGWHGDAWYDQGREAAIPREIKLGVYLTDVESGAFNYIRGTHAKQPPRPVRASELRDVPADLITEVKGPAGTAFAFDTSGIHRQGVPILDRRRVVFFDYHDPAVPLQREDVDYYRYHALLLNAAFLGDLSRGDHRILGFGNMGNFVPAFERAGPHGAFQRMFRVLFDAKLCADEFHARVRARLGRYVTIGTMRLGRQARPRGA